MVFEDPHGRELIRRSRCASCTALAGLGQEAEASGAVTAMEEASGASTFKSISIGVVTGLAVWTLTRVLDRAFAKGKR